MVSGSKLASLADLYFLWLDSPTAFEASQQGQQRRNHTADKFTFDKTHDNQHISSTHAMSKLIERLTD